VLEVAEVYAITSLPIVELIKVHTEPKYHFQAQALTAGVNMIDIHVERDSFPFNWDDYHFKIELLSDRYLKGERNLIY